ncbi:hypothetical protein PGTUg99_030970 [Puccinia graminis f. sp. tritici]|uniref:DUF1746 domain-containing protein n=1 Tax=Puccinia graminis f. sp. tritici TaxID=56615 RepID=A0A5B0PJQ2_PUCGR|nr:hypothetical protein PGTUg99_030970 [Puccinia graminis f. sp. tritici]
MDYRSSAQDTTADSSNINPVRNVNITNITSMFDEREQSDDESQESERCQRAEQRRKIKLAMLMQQLEFLFYALVVLCYTLDGKNLIFILRTVSEVQFSQPKQIQPDRPLRFFALASFAICFCALSSHLSLLSSSNYDPSGILVDFIGQFTWNHPLAIIAFLVGLDVFSCLVQLLLVLISFTQSHSIPISADPTAAHHYESSTISPDHQDLEDLEANQPPSKPSGTDPLLDLRNSVEERSDESNETSRRGQSRVTNEASDFQQDLFLFDLTVSQVKSLLFSTNPPTSNRPSTTASLTASPTSTPRPSRPLVSAQVPIVSTGNTETTEGGNHQIPENRDQANLSSSAEPVFVPPHLPSRNVVIPIV